MRAFLLGSAAGITLLAALIFSYLAGLESGRKSIVDDCMIHRAFTFQDQAWGCVRLRRSSQEYTMDNSTAQGVDL